MTSGEQIEAAVRELAPGRTRTAAFMGWVPDLPDHRDFRYTARDPDERVGAALPVSGFDTRITKQPVFDQGPRGSCVGQSVALMHAIERKVSPRSALFAYWHARLMNGWQGEDTGAYIRDGVKVLNVEGAPRDDLWPDVQNNLYLPPPVRAETDAEKRRIFSYFRCEGPQAQRQSLASKHGFVIGFSVYDNFWQGGYNGGIVGMPTGRMDGGHAIYCWGYHDDARHSELGEFFERQGIPRSRLPETVRICRNSYGSKWGMRGQLTLGRVTVDMAGSFVIDGRFFDDLYLADDAWTVRKTKEPTP